MKGESIWCPGIAMAARGGAVGHGVRVPEVVARAVPKVPKVHGAAEASGRAAAHSRLILKSCCAKARSG